MARLSPTPEFGEITTAWSARLSNFYESGKLPWHPSFFEMLTVMAFEYFASIGVEIACWKSAWAGVWTRLMWSSRLISVIADISLDHRKYLGDTIAEIAREKAGIIRQNGVVVTLPQRPQANDVIGHVIEEECCAWGQCRAKYVPPISPGPRPIWRGGRRRARPQPVSSGGDG